MSDTNCRRDFIEIWSACKCIRVRLPLRLGNTGEMRKGDGATMYSGSSRGTSFRRKDACHTILGIRCTPEDQSRHLSLLSVIRQHPFKVVLFAAEFTFILDLYSASQKKTEPWNNGMLWPSCGVYDYNHIYIFKWLIVEIPPVMHHSAALFSKLNVKIHLCHFKVGR